jgi:hypothetical protein
MDRTLIPILVLLIPVLAVFFSGLQKLARLRIEETRLRAGSSGSADVEELRGDVQQLRQELGEMQERLDFAERLLARGDRAPLAEPTRKLDQPR